MQIVVIADGKMQTELQDKQIPFTMEVSIRTDVPGMIAPRTTSLIVNEAFLITDADFLNKDEVEAAMKRGINFPLGPFEWAEKNRDYKNI